MGVKLNHSLNTTTTSAAKRKCNDSDDSDEENHKRSVSASGESWQKHISQLKRQKNKNHDNYDSKQFVSQFRKPLAIMPANTVSDPKSLLNSSSGAIDPSAKSHVITVQTISDTLPPQLLKLIHFRMTS